ncbi:MAG: carbohydrate kinase family protein [Kiritimatiellae bacterium]|nr:carbohydrate kinase family protein [Kiritimatiellia bacterium]
MPYDVVVVGNIGIDTNVYFPHGDYSPWVESAFTEDLDYIGQAGGYTARGYARLGYSTAFIGYVGEDCLGRFIREQLTQDGINTDALFIDPAGTSRSINMMMADGRRKNFYDGKSHMTRQPDLDLCESVLRGARLIHMHLPNWARRLLPAARRSGAVIACDLQDVTDPQEAYRRDFVEAADILFFSAVNHADPSPLIRQFQKADARKIVVAGMGAEGCALGMHGTIRSFPPVKMVETVVDTNGAGDGLAVGFLSGHVLEQCEPEHAIQRGQTVARFTCSLKADSDHLITREQLNARCPWNG